MSAMSLRMRLFVLILVPLVVLAVVVGFWAYRDAESGAAERFDRSLLSTALAVSRDIALTGGNALGEDTRDLLRDTSGGAVFYHVYAPDGAFVTGYATPPVPRDAPLGETGYAYFDAAYFGEPVRALRYTQRASVDGLAGLFTYTVWQPTAVRDGFVRTQTMPVFAALLSMIGALAVLVWFGVGRGLAPLLSLEDAIARRSVDDLSPIRRRIPNEVSGIVGRFNSLLGDLSASIEAKDAFISDAAHQLRNPIAGVMALTESVASAKDMPTVHERSQDLRRAVQDVSHLTNSLLTLERMKAGLSAGAVASFDVVQTLRDLAAKMASEAREAELRFTTALPRDPVVVTGDKVMLEQAVLNVLRNAVVHGGPQVSVLRLSAERTDQHLDIVVEDDGKGIEATDFERALGRFRQVGPSAGSGLGLPIAEAIVRNHGGSIRLEKTRDVFRVVMTLPVDGARRV